MKLKSYINLTPDSNLMRTVEVRLAGDAAPASPFVLLGDLTHEEGTDNASGMQKHTVSHAIYSHVQEQVYLKHKLQDMQRIKIVNAGAFKLVDRVLVDQEANRLGINVPSTITVKTTPSDATTDGVVFTVSNPDLVDIVANTGNGVFTFKGKSKGEVFIHVHVKGTSFNQSFPYEFTEQLAPVLTVNVASVTIAPTTKALIVGATQQLVPTVLPANATVKTVTYASSAPAVASVTAGGLVTALTAGSANITCTTTNGAKTAVCAVTVTAA